MKQENTESGSDVVETSSIFRDKVFVVSMIFISFFSYSLIKSPVPGVNEPHYLCKAKHFWDRSWCDGDLFLQSLDTHYVFYYTVGALTQWMPLEWVAWIGRFVGILLLSLGWTKLLSRITTRLWSPLWSSWIYLAITAIGSTTRMPFFRENEFQIFDLSGEWILGGIEGKVFAYALLFWGIACLLDQRRVHAALLLGLAVSFHPVVGAWGVISIVFSYLLFHGNRISRDLISRNNSFVLRNFLMPVIIFSFCAIPGLIPVLGLIGPGNQAVSREAEYIQVFIRLGHHLDPMRFSVTDYLSYFYLLIFWWFMRRRLIFTRHEKFFALFITGTVIIALSGLLIGFHAGSPDEMYATSFRTRLMKLYPFRLCDVMVPIAASIVLGEYLCQAVKDYTSRKGNVFLNSSNLWRWFIFSPIMLLALVLPSADSNPSRMNDNQLADWKEMCRWIRTNTPPDALCLTPRNTWAFKWYSGRAEYVSHKDFPQDYSSIVEWYRRIKNVEKWNHRFLSSGLLAEDLHVLSDDTGAAYIISNRNEMSHSNIVYENRSFAVYHSDEFTLEDQRQ